LNVAVSFAETISYATYPSLPFRKLQCSLHVYYQETLESLLAKQTFKPMTGTAPTGLIQIR
jgi:hypothetical protein